jgi:hypothetical protein
MAVATGTALLVAAGASIVGSKIAADAAGEAGKAQAQEAQKALDWQKEVYAKNQAQMQKFMADAAKYSQPTISDINALQKMVQISDAQNASAIKSIESGQKILDSVNPALQAAGDETLKLIKGQADSILNPVRDQRNRQKTELENQLAQRFGASFRFSAAGIKALNDFDNQTAETMYNAHMGALNSVVNAASGLSNIASQTQANMLNQIQTAQGANASIINANDALAKRQQSPFYIGAQFQPNAGGVAGAQQMNTQAIGNQYAGGIAFGQGIANFGANLGQGALTYALGNPSAASPSPATYVPTGSAQTGTGLGVPNFNVNLPKAPTYNIGDFTK